MCVVPYCLYVMKGVLYERDFDYVDCDCDYDYEDVGVGYLDCGCCL